MANQEHLDLLKQGVEVWNAWIMAQKGMRPNFSEINLKEMDLSRAWLAGANFFRSNLSAANLTQAVLSGAQLYEANLYEANLFRTLLIRADLSRADLRKANLREAHLTYANLSEANFYGATLTNCYVYAISAWNVNLEHAIQSDLIITPKGESIITVDNLEVAQFIYLLLNNEKIREVIDTITSKVVLILGRFTSKRKAVLDALKDELRQHNYSPVLFDFKKPLSRDITETVSTLAHMARFVIADITDAKSIPQELKSIVPNLPSVPVLPLILNSQHEYGMFEHFSRFPWVLPLYRYTDQASLLQSLREKVIEPAEQKAKELEKR